MKKILLTLSFAFLLTGCANVDITKTSSNYYDPTQASSVEVLKTKPDRPYEELGTVTIEGFDSRDVAAMHNAVRTKAAALGANGVILTDEGLIPGSWGSFKRWATGVAIRYKDAK